MKTEISKSCCILCVNECIHLFFKYTFDAFNDTFPDLLRQTAELFIYFCI